MSPFHVDQATADRWIADKRAVLFGKGGPCVRCEARYKAMLTGEHDGPHERHAPAWMVELAKPCETCTPHRPGSTVIDTCPDCHNGKRRIEVRVLCPGPPHHGFYGPGKDACPGYVTVGTVVHQWGPLPVRHVLDPIDGDDEVVVSLDGRLWRLGKQLTLPPDIDPASLVGQYAAAFEALP